MHTAGPETYLEYWRTSWTGGGWLWLTEGARTLTEEAPGKYFYHYYSFFLVLFCSVVGVLVFNIFLSFVL